MSSPLELIIQSQQMTRLMRGQRKLGRLPKPPKDNFPVTLEREYRSKILTHFEIARKIVREELIPNLPALERDAAPRRDGQRYDINWARALNRIFSGVDTRRKLREAGFNDPKQFADDAAREIARGNLRAIRRQVKSVLGLDIFVNDTNLQDMLDSFGDENARLIKTMNEDFITRIQTITTQALRQGRRAGSIEKEILRLLGDEEDKTRKRAALIARDQLASLRGDVTRERQTQLGVKRYKWRTSLDSRVRPAHRNREGDTFEWDDPPPDGHPGKPILCRCTAEPIIDDLL